MHVLVSDAHVRALGNACRPAMAWAHPHRETVERHADDRLVVPPHRLEHGMQLRLHLLALLRNIFLRLLCVEDSDDLISSAFVNT